jgi:hypothetical protein
LTRGIIPAFTVGSDWRFNIESIDRWRLGQDRPVLDSKIAWAGSAR